MTIEGGAGWQLAAADATDAADTLEGAPEPAAERSWPRRRQLGALLLAAAVGFAAATVVANQRLKTLQESDDGVLSLDVAPASLESPGDLVAAADGAPAVVISVSLRNTGPRAVALESAAVVGTEFRAEDVAGRRIASRDRTVVRLVQPVRCDRRAEGDRPGPLRVRAMTGAGSKTVDLRVDVSSLGFTTEVMRSACGLTPPPQALLATESAPAELSGLQARVPSELSNASAFPILLREVRLSPGLRLVAIEDELSGQVELPIELPPGDYDPPVEPFLGRGPARSLTFVVEVADCDALPPPGMQDQFFPLFEATVTGLPGAEELSDGMFHGVGGSAWGDPRTGERLRQASCPPARESQLAPVPPLTDPARVRSEQELRLL